MEANQLNWVQILREANPGASHRGVLVRMGMVTSQLGGRAGMWKLPTTAKAWQTVTVLSR
jgi:hypothetical protein